VEALAADYRLVLITKGDLLDQERKLAQSGLGDLFDGVEIVSNKTAASYRRDFRPPRHRRGRGADGRQFVEVRRDLPAIEAGGWGVFVPHDTYLGASRPRWPPAIIGGFTPSPIWARFPLWWIGCKAPHS
jgi:hypothetical protein